ncbi:Macrolide-specific efflux protein macA precursor [Providencia rustigianii]|uniref:Auxiliary transport protein, membrane fusion protein (MFP) family protein n=2 Tax=Providencia rustigianii TaxID=158850 RepID=D1NXI3_9GAMM|nr:MULTISPECIES: secretion protein HlyD [Providencia]EFB74122.1 auxiliary transport protein, membrane fusion protein (MFP) family protein [Providencia rustigianii DSM 4541]MTC56958.1 secretion protein HlyD [Providencia rustigianii]MTC61755.1 secretion protein HlyD [Providencia rustigianii]SPY76952.1 Macrolide-specific efflux protein macA precursor [Providencia rustigianii]SUC26185.1 Macrolide-specific efflux protein macA precursor [Providencia rustigianii]
MNNKRRSVIILIIVILIAAAGGYYYQSMQSPSLALYGNVDVRTVNLSFRVGGKLASLDVDEGAKVTSGQQLGKLDDAPYINALNKAKGVRDSAKAQLALKESGYRTQEIAQVEAEVAQRQAAWQYADSFFKRQQGLAAQRLISANDLDNARNNRNQTLAALKASQDKLNQYQSGFRQEEIAAARGEWLQAEAAVAQAELDLADTILTAPSDGTILTRAIEPGTIIGAGNTVFSVTLTNPVWVRAYVSEAHLGDAIPGSKVLLYTDSQPNTPYHGTIGFVSPTAEFTPKSVQTPDLRTDLVYRLRIIVDDPNDKLRQGMPVTIQFTDAQK